MGGLRALIARVDANFATLDCWVRETGWIDFLAADPHTRSHTSVCLKIVDPVFTTQGEEQRHDTVKKLAGLLEREGVAFDIAGHRNAPPGLRIWCGATIERDDIEALTPWLDWAWSQVRQA
jgi:phosphoserine aminotransferase